MDNFSLQDFSTDNGISRATFSVASNTPKKRTGSKKLRETRHPVYRGVRMRKPGKWVCEIREPNKKTRIWLGTYSTADMAARAHDVAAIALRGRSACLNFADSAWTLPAAASADAESIQKAATEAAKWFGESDVEVVSPEDTMEETTVVSPENEFFTDEDDLFGMTSLINSMAEGLMLPPPYCMKEDDDAELASYVDVSLWTY